MQAWQIKHLLCNTLSQQGIHEELLLSPTYSIPQNQVICTT